MAILAALWAAFPTESQGLDAQKQEGQHPVEFLVQFHRHPPPEGLWEAYLRITVVVSAHGPHIDFVDVVDVLSAEMCKGHFGCIIVL